MCSRYENKAPAPILAERFGIDIPALPNKPDIRPTDLGLIIEGRAGTIQRWGLRSSWGKAPLINARCESLAQKMSFKGLLKRRVLVPATKWWEWTRDAQDRPDRKMSLRPSSGDVFSFAGLTDGEQFTIITCDAVPAMNGMNDRMPVILDAAAEVEWLDADIPFDAVKNLLRPFDHALLIERDEEDAPQLKLF